MTLPSYRMFLIVHHWEYAEDFFKKPKRVREKKSTLQNSKSGDVIVTLL